jgi:hypothetical protein
MIIFHPGLNVYQHFANPIQVSAQHAYKPIVLCSKYTDFFDDSGKMEVEFYEPTMNEWLLTHIRKQI